ncbi:MAG: sigma-54-dependent Fis family transcriptional regulator [Hyphomicrobiales bacterium]|nr:sigma-54-dependent Fis family transcriptional regulator [Hyphomicrobiales bacterium]
MVGKILIVDDDPVQRRLLDAMISKFGYHTTLAESGDQAITILRENPAASFQLILLDLVMPGLDGLGVLDKIRQMQLKIPVVVQTAKGGIDTVVNAVRSGAYDFVVKPVSPERIKITIENALSLGAMKAEVTRLRKTAAGKLKFDDIISSSANMQRVITLGKKAARSNIPILIEGESGVGKELIARAIQGTSRRAKNSFITVNCGAMPENLIESVLFGHEKGAFTGATSRHIGKFEEADGGTLFLDEVGELPLSTQVKLLRALQEGEIDPIGSKRPVKTDFRLISATNRTLLEETSKGNFREDLYYRLSVFPIRVPSLRERKEEIPELARHFLARFSMEEGRTHIKSVSPQALHLLSMNEWPGNIRQLENAIFRAVILCEGNELVADDFPQITAAISPSALVTTVQTTNDRSKISEPSVHTIDSTAPDPRIDPVCNARTYPQQNTHSTRLTTDEGEIKELEDIEAEMIRFAIEFYNGKLSEVAKRLGIGRSTLYRRLKELGIDDDPQTDGSQSSKTA